jgi:hypothetical protein
MGKNVVSISVLVYFKGTPIEATAKKLIKAFKTNKPLFFHLRSITNDKNEKVMANKK